MVLQLSPVALLTIIFPIATRRIADTEVGGTELSALLLASSLTVPWLSQAVCLPLYRAIGPLILEGDMEKIRGRFCEVWPTTLVKTLPAAALFAVPLQIAMRWPVPAFLAYVTLCLLHGAFAQSLVLANVGRRRSLWAAAWVGYAAALIVFPTVWYLPPLVGLLTQIVPLRRHLRYLRRRVTLESAGLVSDVLRGALLGAVLWADKLFLFLKYGNSFPVSTIFLALLPSVIAYNYYFVRLTPRFDECVSNLRHAMENEAYGTLKERSGALAAAVDFSLSRTAFVGALLGFYAAVVLSAQEPQRAPLIVTVTIASWFFMMTTVLCYKLDYIGQTSQAQVISGTYLAFCAFVFVLFPLGPRLYAFLIAAVGMLFLAALHSCVIHWRRSEYTLFWRHATAW